MKNKSVQHGSKSNFFLKNEILGGKVFLGKIHVVKLMLSTNKNNMF